MGKITFRPVVTVLFRTKVVAAMPVLGSFMFLVGSVAFLPHFIFVTPLRIAYEVKPDEGSPEDESEFAAVSGASCFIAGSCFFFIAPALDFLDMTYSARDLKASAAAETQLEKKYKAMYEATIILGTRVNALLYAVSGACFIAGSALFLPDFWIQTSQGAWLFLMGCIINILGAILATGAALQLHEKIPKSDDGYLSDEMYTIISCSLYILGDIIYAIGSILFFPDQFGILTSYNVTALVSYRAIAYQSSIILFIVGSIVFLVGSGIDLYVVTRTRRSHEGLPSVSESSGLIRQ